MIFSPRNAVVRWIERLVTVPARAGPVADPFLYRSVLKNRGAAPHISVPIG
jgi:hypothetical protein